jgi:hypothetical protein
MAAFLDAEGHLRVGRMLAEEADDGGMLKLVGDLRMDPDRALRLLGALKEGFAAGCK